jgi:DUF1680 family protein
MKKVVKIMVVMLIIVSCGKESRKDYPIQPVQFTDVSFTDRFWSPRLETNRKVSIPYDFKKCEETGRIDNFAKAGGLMEGEFIGIRYNDSDVYKVIEGASYSLSIFPNPELEKYLDDLIAKIAAAQEDDGYLYTTRTIDPGNPARSAGDTRWSYLLSSHELYNVGHMYEAAVAYYQATGKRSLLDVAINSANLIDSVFGPGKKHDVPGHQEIEIGLAKLYRVTGEKKYLDLAKFFLDERGYAHGRDLYTAYGNAEYTQDHKPVLEQDEAVGHAVRAAYMYSGMADIAALTGDAGYVKAIDKIWENVVSKKFYITGGIGALHKGEAFGDNYELPNASAYNETCAAIANMMWNYRLFLLNGDAKYIDVLERTLYNGFLSGVSFDGNEFFYQNPLESFGNHKRSPWFDCSCCPTNVVRFLPSLPGYVYAQKNGIIYINLFISSNTSIKIKDNTVRLKQETQYPWEGTVKIFVEPEKSEYFAVYIRIPGWSQGQPVPSDLYRFLNTGSEKVFLKVNGEEFDLVPDKGFARIERVWQKGDFIELNMPMQIRKVLANEKVKDDAGRYAIERGPIVYCAEWKDNRGHVLNLFVPEDTKFTAEHKGNMLNGVTVITGKAFGLYKSENDGSVEKKEQELLMIPYYAWAHRGQGEMIVWLPYEEKIVRPQSTPTFASSAVASTSHTYQGDTEKALNDGIEPKHSNDQAIPRFTWWNHKGTKEWVQYDFEKPHKFQSIEVYWFDDTNDGGGCHVPASWKLLYRTGGQWKEVSNISGYGLEKDKYNKVTFDQIITKALRIEVQLEPDLSGGILEWRVN